MKEVSKISLYNFLASVKKIMFYIKKASMQVGSQERGAAFFNIIM